MAGPQHHRTGRRQGDGTGSAPSPCCAGRGGGRLHAGLIGVDPAVGLEDELLAALLVAAQGLELERVAVAAVLDAGLLGLGGVPLEVGAGSGVEAEDSVDGGAEEDGHHRVGARVVVGEADRAAATGLDDDPTTATRPLEPVLLDRHGGGAGRIAALPRRAGGEGLLVHEVASAGPGTDRRAMAGAGEQDRGRAVVHVGDLPDEWWSWNGVRLSPAGGGWWRWSTTTRSSTLRPPPRRRTVNVTLPRRGVGVRVGRGPIEGWQPDAHGAERVADRVGAGLVVRGARCHLEVIGRLLGRSPGP